jgi:hypothetical protein
VTTKKTKSAKQIKYKSIATQVVRRKGTLRALKGAEQALFIALDKLNNKDMMKLQAFLDSLDHEPIFIAEDSALH